MGCVAADADAAKLGPSGFIGWVKCNMFVDVFLEEKGEKFTERDDLACMSYFSKDTGQDTHWGHQATAPVKTVEDD